ncbi:FkbM family methyltransferase [Campylobacter sp. MIT 21-1685]|uniref:FkbM family methyltransferase n=1 Tax=unclassified Campylobacter TaxID=2593542 RepID=UPI00224B46D1|nr:MULTISPECIES: FkbM family methyltransferase [unclassified Campylobacter]MCX2683316.1 FkbM family methyltransferase [Campylobacter sp. MIT 21-1684]MCX2807828.1 FkbM family methyltransferase [Campylobacter sp. MIT 21-1685]
MISDILLHCGAFVYSFEPNRYLNFFLKKKYQANTKIQLFNKAVGHKNFYTQFLTFQGRILSQGNRIVSSLQDKETSEAYEVEVIDLCEFIETLLEKNESIYFLKLDIEGAEFELMEKLIQKGLYKAIKYIACETHEYMFEESEKKLAKISNLIKKHKTDNIFLDWV